MPNLSQEEAREFIAEVREDNGGITPEDREFLAANRPSALRALQKTRRQLADSIKIVVDNLYSKETRFLYELIQNAEDNSYSIATAAGEAPFLAFKVYPDRIIVDSNEDGFSKSNISAICSVGNSTKKHSAGYIGEKGIGFKSVFKIAQKVHIHSGSFSFAFSHTREDDDDGLGMITPYYVDAEDLPTGVRTRMTLTLLDSTKFEERASEFRAVPDTFLMFLSRLQRLSIELYQPDDALTATQYSKREAKENGLYTTFLAKTTRKGKKESTSEQKYYTMKNGIHNLPFDEARKDKQGNSIDRATVILAFPVDEHDEPVLKQQYTYAFLPLRRVGFKFLIQADFVTQANREDVVHSRRNQAVLKGVAEAFVDAAVVFCKRPSLRYRWMRYLPEDFISDEFWRTLWTMIRDKLEQTSLLEPWSGHGLYKPSDLEKLSDSFIAEDRSPLLPDLEGAEVYLSPKYTEGDFQTLKRLGTTTLRWSSFIDRLEADLRSYDGSKWRYMKNNADWRTRICKLLSRAFIENIPNQQKRLRALALIPLRDGTWVSSDSATRKYFPNTDGISIPADLGLDLVRPMAAKNVAWADLLSTLGVMSCPRDSVISSIYRRYNATNLDNFKVSNAVAHIRYLYWFLPTDYSSLTPEIRLANQHGSLLKKDQYLYFPNEDDDFSPSKLFKQDGQLPGHPVHYLHGDYLTAVHPDIIHNGRPWMRWLEEKAGVRRRPELRDKGSDGLSKEFQYIVNHRSNKLLGTLKRGWDYYRLQMNNVVEGELRNSAVLLETGRRTSLLHTFLPLPKLKQVAAELRIADAYPFIAISELLRDEERLEWGFVSMLRVGIEENLDFYLSALETFKAVNPALNTASARDHLARIYQNIQLRSSEGLDRVRDMFRRPFIWIPPSSRVDSTWLSTADCVWDGPPWLKSKQCLKLDVYLELEHLIKVSLKTHDASQVDIVKDLLMLKTSTDDKSALRSQTTASTRSNTGTAGTPYQVTLEGEGLNNKAMYQSITFMEAYKKQSFEELRLEDYNMARKPSNAFAGLENDKIIEEAEKRYNELWKYSMNDENLESRKALRCAFEDSGLVYIPKENAWCPPRDCVWVESRVKIPGKASIADAYPCKKTFFTTVLKISEPTVGMYVDTLTALAKGKASAAQTKETMALICRLGVGKTDFSSLVEAKILPVKLANGVRTFASASSKDELADFAIVENTIHWEAFKDKIVVLDFSLEEIRATRPLLLALGLEDRFSSKLVKEVTDVRGGFQDHEMTRILHTKSQAIVRCAFHFTSPDKRPDVASLYRKFKRAMIYVSDGIRCSLQITQDGHRIEGASSQATFHFEEVEGALRLYLPRDEADRDLCFESDLPRIMCTFLGITNEVAEKVIGGVFRIDKLAVVGKILDKEGVVEVDYDFAGLDKEFGASEAESLVKTLVEATSDIRLSTPTPINRILEKEGVGQVDHEFAAMDGEFGASKAESGVETLVEATSDIRLSTSTSGPLPYTSSSAPRSYTPSGWARWREAQSGSENAEDVRDNIIRSPSYQERQKEVQETAYKRILEHVVNVARQRVHSGVFESTGVSNRGPVTIEALPQGTIQGAFATRTQERDHQLGAAGELYMFEFLKGLGLPKFGLENWKSEIRDRVKMHADYQDLEKDNDRSAIADIEYLDESRRLTQFLTQKGHLAQGLWDSERPLYHIEIKTTTSPNWQEPFFMSKAQERHIQDQRIEDGRSRSSIYMICRIFNLGKGDETGMHIYLDPATKRRNGELAFSTHTWAVKPLTHPTMPAGNGIARASATGPAGVAAITAGPSGDTGTNNPRNASFFASLGSSTTNSVPKSGNSTLGSSTLGSQKKTESSGGGLFGSNSAPSGNNASTQPPPTSGFFGTTKPSSTEGSFFDSNGVSPNNETPKAPSLGLFSSKATSPNSDVPNAAPKGGLFSFNTMSANDHTSKATSTGYIFGKPADSDALKATSPSTTGFTGFRTYNSTGSSSGTGSGSGTATAGSAFGTATTGSPFGPPTTGSASGTPTTGSAFGTPTTDSGFGTAKTGSLFSAPTTGSPFGTTTKGFSFGTPTTSKDSGPSRSASGFSFGTASATPGGFGTNATTSTSHSTFKFANPAPTASPSFPISTGSAATDSIFAKSLSASNQVNKDNPFAHQSPSPSPAPTPKPRSP